MKKKIKPEEVYGMPWEKLSMNKRAEYACEYDNKRLKDIDVSKVGDLCIRANVIRLYPKAADTYDINQFDSAMLSIWLLQDEPRLFKHVEKSRYSKLSWGYILAKQPQLAKHCDFSWLRGSDWYILLTKQPQFADRFWPEFCDDSYDWRWVLAACPKLWRKCPIDSFSRKEQLHIASASMPILRKLDVTTFTADDWTRFFGVDHECTGPVFKTVAKELARLSGRMRLS